MSSYIYEEMYRQLPILDEHNSQITFQCPCCKGKIRASKNHLGKYLCVTEGCPPHSIRQKLGIKSQNPHTLAYPEMAKLKYSKTDSIIGVKNYEENKKVFSELNEDAKVTKYFLNDTSYIKRIDYWNPEFDKIFYPEIKEECPPFFNEFFLENKYGVVTFLEGEKSAEHFTKVTGLLGLCVSKIHSEKCVLERLNKLKSNISKILYFPDYDEAGDNNANKFQKLANENMIQVKILKPYMGKKKHFQKGDDCVEFSKLFDLKQFIIKNL